MYVRGSMSGYVLSVFVTTHAMDVYPCVVYVTRGTIKINRANSKRVGVALKWMTRDD